MSKMENCISFQGCRNHRANVWPPCLRSLLEAPGVLQEGACPPSRLLLSGVHLKHQQGLGRVTCLSPVQILFAGQGHC